MGLLLFILLLQYIDHYEQYIITIYFLKHYIDYYSVDNNNNNNNNIIMILRASYIENSIQLLDFNETS